MPTITKFYQWSPQWRDKPQTHEVLAEVANKDGSTTAVSVATCSSKGWALKVEQALNKLLKEESSTP